MAVIPIVRDVQSHLVQARRPLQSKLRERIGELPGIAGGREEPQRRALDAFGLREIDVVAALHRAYRALAGPGRLKLKELPRTIALAFVAFVAPLLPFTVYLWRLTANPVFPLGNTFFKSAYWPTDGGWV